MGPENRNFTSHIYPAAWATARMPGTHIPRSSASLPAKERTVVPRHGQAKKMAEWQPSRGELKVCPRKPYPIH